MFFHLEHWERIFNGFGHLTSGITQELIAIVVLAAVAVAYLVMLRKSDDGASVPKRLGVAVGRAVGRAGSPIGALYTMAARPARDSVLWILYVLGNASVLGPATFAFLPQRCLWSVQPARRVADWAPAAFAALVGSGRERPGRPRLLAIFPPAPPAPSADVGYYFDPTHPDEAAGLTPVATVGA